MSVSRVYPGMTNDATVLHARLSVLPSTTERCLATRGTSISRVYPGTTNSATVLHAQCCLAPLSVA